MAVSESGRVEYTVKWDDSDPELGEDSETAGFSRGERPLAERSCVR